MREIKFRAWDEENERMVGHPFVVNNEGKVFEEYRGGGYMKPHFKLMQFTGLKDKNGVEIYEGDILECNYCKKDFGQVVWQHDMVRFQTMWNQGCCGNARHTRIDHWATKVGNIYQNPELLAA